MKIWIDIRNLQKKSHFYNFIIKQVESLIINDKNNTYIIYSSFDISLSEYKNYENKLIIKQKCKIKEQYILTKQYNKDKLDLIIYTSISTPLLFKWKNIFILESLKNLIYPDNLDTNIIKKYINIFLFKRTLKKANLILTLDSNTKLNINESYNIKEEKISLLQAFFDINNENNINKIIDIKLKYNLKNNYIIYEWWTWSNKNIPRLLDTIIKINKKSPIIDLIILWDNSENNFEIKNIIDNKWVTENIHFINNIEEKNKKDYYNQSIWYILPSLYESFPFVMNKAISYNTRIISSNLDSIKEIFWNNIEYINPLSNINMKNNLENFIKNKQSKVDYKKIIKKYSIKNSTDELLWYIKNI